MTKMKVTSAGRGHVIPVSMAMEEGTLYLFLWLWGKGRACLGRGFVSAAFAVQKFIDEVTFAGIRVLISESRAFHYVLIDGEKI